jgi:hypothetical protein
LIVEAIGVIGGTNIQFAHDPVSERQYIIYEALRKGMPVEELYQLTHIKHWFVQQMKELVEQENEILKYKGKVLPDALLIRAKKDGFSDRKKIMIIGGGPNRIGQGIEFDYTCVHAALKLRERKT